MEHSVTCMCWVTYGLWKTQWLKAQVILWQAQDWLWGAMSSCPSFIHSCFPTLWFSASLHRSALSLHLNHNSTLKSLQPVLCFVSLCFCIKHHNCIVSRITTTYVQHGNHALIRVVCYVPDCSVPLTSLSHIFVSRPFMRPRGENKKKHCLLWEWWMDLFFGLWTVSTGSRFLHSALLMWNKVGLLECKY